MGLAVRSARLQSAPAPRSISSDKFPVLPRPTPLMMHSAASRQARIPGACFTERPSTDAPLPVGAKTTACQALPATREQCPACARSSEPAARRVDGGSCVPLGFTSVCGLSLGWKSHLSRSARNQRDCAETGFVLLKHATELDESLSGTRRTNDV